MQFSSYNFYINFYWNFLYWRFIMAFSYYWICYYWFSLDICIEIKKVPHQSLHLTICTARNCQVKWAFGSLITTNAKDSWINNRQTLFDVWWDMGKACQPVECLDAVYISARSGCRDLESELDWALGAGPDCTRHSLDMVESQDFPETCLHR